MFVAAIVVHLMRIFFTGAFRKPRDVNWMIGLTLLIVAILEGFAGYSLPDDLLSGMGLAIGYGVALSIPVVGANVALPDLGRRSSRAPRASSRGCSSPTCSCCRRCSRR